MGRVLDDWIGWYREFTKNTEPPESYHIWTAISVIAGTLERKAYMPWGHSRIYPNMYVVLVGPSGRTRKGVALDIGSNIFSTAFQGVNQTPESVTKERLIQLFTEALSSYTDPVTKVQVFQSPLTTFSKELSVFLGQKDIGFIANLTDWYDSHEVWRNETKTAGKDYISGICYNLIAATAPDWFQSILPVEAVGGGFTSRIIFIVEENKREAMADPPPPDRKLQKMLVSDLQKIHLLTGAFTFNEKAKSRYIDWYLIEDAKMERGDYPIKDPRFNGYAERRATHVKKISMVISASRSDEKIVTIDHFNDALQIMEITETKMHRVFGGFGVGILGDSINKIIDILVRRKKIKKSELMNLFYRDLSPAQLDEVITALRGMKVIDYKLVDNNSDYLYTYILDGSEG